MKAESGPLRIANRTGSAITGCRSLRCRVHVNIEFELLSRTFLLNQGHRDQRTGSTLCPVACQRSVQHKTLEHNIPGTIAIWHIFVPSWRCLTRDSFTASRFWLRSGLGRNSTSLVGSGANRCVVHQCISDPGREFQCYAYELFVPGVFDNRLTGIHIPIQSCPRVLQRKRPPSRDDEPPGLARAVQ